MLVFYHIGDGKVTEKTGVRLSMGSGIEVNDTLQLTTRQGFPSGILNLARHQDNPVTVEDVKGKVFEFAAKDGARVFHLDPVRVYLVENVDGKWIFWGRALIQSQTISKKSDNPIAWETSGTYIITDIYEPEYQRLFTKHESPAGRSYF
jgi:hypothetical protein